MEGQRRIEPHGMCCGRGFQAALGIPIENKLLGNGLTGLAGVLAGNNGRSLIESKLSIRNRSLVDLPSVSLEIPRFSSSIPSDPDDS
jgi:hypothetical protein